MSSAVSHDIYYRIFKPGANEKERLRVGRIMIFLAVVLAGYFGINPPGFVGEVVAFAFGLAAASLFPAILLGIFDKRMNRQGATSGIVVGLVFTLFMLLSMRSVQVFGTETQFIDNFLGVDALGIGVIGAALNFIVALIVSRMTAPPPEHISQMVEDIRVPKVTKKE